jgi:hypothetical protein
MKDWQKIFEKQNDQIEKFDETKQNTAENQKLLKKKFNKLKHKALYIDAEYEDTCDIFSHAQREFISKMFSYCSDKKIEPPLSDNSKEKQKNENNETSEELKDLYREIVKATHPDKTKDLPEDEIEERKELYHEAVRGKQEGDYWGIFKAALELDVPIKKLSFAYLEELENTINDLEQKTNKMKEDLMYKWYYADEKIQSSIFEQLTKNQEKYE